MSTVVIDKIVTGAVVDLADLKQHQIVQHDADDDLLSGYLLAAHEYAQTRIQRTLLLTRYRRFFDAWPCGEVRLSYPPVRAIEGVYYSTDTGTEVLDPDLFESAAWADTFARVKFKGNLPSLPGSMEQVWIDYVAGYGDYTPVQGFPYSYPMVYSDSTDYRYQVKETVRQAIRMLVGHWYENRETVAVGTISSEIQMATNHLLHQSRVLGI